ncbi:MAG TPA: 6-phosphogluconolactonase [Gaiellaceae bacterium]|nr:6-phosphogluconolactonase [Gaiellaceae bacterium]
MTLYGVEIVRLADKEAAASFVADELVAAARAGSSIALTGGRSPGRAYELAAEREPDWSGATLWWGDERAVPPDDENSNYRLADETLIGLLTGRPQIRRIRGELGAQAAADEYDRLLEGVRLDLILLGLGPDGHAASLFPNQPTLDERSRRAIPAKATLEPFVERVTMTLPVLCSAAEVLYLATGESKAEAVERAFAQPPSRDAPASLVRSTGGRTRAALDEAAASSLPH